MMTPEEQDGQLLDDYLAGKLTPAEEAYVLSRAQNDADFSDLLELYRIEHATVEQALRDEFRAKIKDWETNPPPPPDLGSGFRWLYLLGLLPIIVIAWWALRGPSSSPSPTPSPAPAAARPSTETQDTPAAVIDTIPPVFAEKTSPDPPPPTPDKGPQLLAMATKAYTLPPALGITLRSSTTDTSAFATGKRLFTEGKYTAALDQLSAIPTEEHPNTYLRALQWRAHALFKLNRFDEAAAVFAELTATTSGLAKERAEWYRALSILAAGNESDARQLLSQMEAAGKDHIFSDQVEKILLALKK